MILTMGVVLVGMVAVVLYGLWLSAAIDKADSEMRERKRLYRVMQANHPPSQWTHEWNAVMKHGKATGGGTVKYPAPRAAGFGARKVGR